MILHFLEVPSHNRVRESPTSAQVIVFTPGCVEVLKFIEEGALLNVAWFAPLTRMM